MGVDDFCFCAREIVFGQLTDGFKKLGAALVVEMAARQSFGRGEQTLADVAGKVVKRELNLGFDQCKAIGVKRGHDRSSARRIPVNCQRLSVL